MLRWIGTLKMDVSDFRTYHLLVQLSASPTYSLVGPTHQLVGLSDALPFIRAPLWLESLT
jgi:hypothetical protein